MNPVSLRPLRHWLFASAATLALGACAAPGPKPPLPQHIQVTWAPTDQLSEVKDNPMQRGLMRPQDWQTALSDYVRKRADELVPPNQTLDVRFDDIKLAGSFEPWHGPYAQDIRILKDIYPPRATLHYRLTDAHGATIREGDSKLSDLAYLQRDPLPTSNDPLRYDKRMLDDWLTKEFRRSGTDTASR